MFQILWKHFSDYKHNFESYISFQAWYDLNDHIIIVKKCSEQDQYQKYQQYQTKECTEEESTNIL